MMYTIWTTRNCNLACTYCYEHNKSASRMDIDLIDSVVSFILNNTESSDAIDVRFHGGEPLLEFDVIREIVKQLSKDKRTKRYFITTNATLLNQEMIDFFKLHGVVISISIDGNRITHDRNRKDKKGRGTFDAVLDKITQLQHSGLDFSARGTFNSETVYLLHDNVRFLYQIGARNISIKPDMFDRGWNEKSLDTLKLELNKNIEFQCDLNKVGESVEIALTHKSECIPLGVCDGGRSSFSILPNGDIFPCLYSVDFEDCLIGNVKTELFSERIDQLISTYREPILECIGCNFQLFCSATRCRYVNRLQTGKYNQPNVVRCNLDSLIGMKMHRNGV